jgi:hypothetical protein
MMPKSKTCCPQSNVTDAQMVQKMKQPRATKKLWISFLWVSFEKVLHKKWRIPSCTKHAKLLIIDCQYNFSM